ncbi:MAG: hypothetical protein IPJ34_43250, partial [Myxococcales bacterium]|nr:hypothetical protein [Myxococcales bacterium]
MDRFEALRDELRAQPCEHTEAWLDRPLREAGPPPINAAFRAVLRKVGHLLLRDVIMQPDPPALRTLNAVDARRLAGWVHDAFSTYENEVHSVHDHPHGDDDLDDEDDLGDAPIDLPRQREALRAWAVERGLERHLQTPAQQILDDRTERAQLRMLFPFATPTLEDVLTVEGQPDPASQSAARALLGSAQLYLQGIALLTVNDRTQT